MFCSIRDCMVIDTFPTPYEGLLALGINAVEIELSRSFEVCTMHSREKIALKDDASAITYRKQLDNLDIRPVSFLTACDFSAGDPEENIRWITRALELASLLGMDNIRIDSAMAREGDLTFGERVKLFSDGLRAVLRRTAGLSVAMGIENHGFQGNNLAFLLNVFLQADSDRLGSTLDTGNFYWRGYPLSEVYGILRVLAPYAKHTHLKNIRYPEEVREKTREAGWEYEHYVSPLEEGDVDHALVLGLLRDAGYRGDICIEDESLGKYPEGEARIQVLERDAAYVKKLIG